MPGLYVDTMALVGVQTGALVECHPCLVAHGRVNMDQDRHISVQINLDDGNTH